MMKIKEYDKMDKCSDLNPNEQGSFAYVYKRKKNNCNEETCDIKNCKDCPKFENEYNIEDYDAQNDLKHEYKDFEILLNRITKRYKDFFRDILDNNNIAYNKQMLELSAVYINEIQNLYLNPINYKLNQLQAKNSIRMGIASILLAFVLAIITYCQSNKDMEQRNSINVTRHNEYIENLNSLKCFYTEHFKSDSISIYNLNNKTDSIISKIDSFKTKMDSIDKRMNSKNKNLK